MRALSFRAQLSVAMAAIILLIAGAVWFYVPRKLEAEAVELVAYKAETLAQLTAFTIHPAIYFRDQNALQEALSGTRADRDVAYVVVIDADGRTLAAHRPQRATGNALARRQSGGALSPDRSLFEVMMPVRDRERDLARLYIGISLDRVHREVADVRRAIGALSALILAAGVFAVAVIGTLLTRPLRHVADAASRIASGDLDSRVPESRGDEIGQLAGSFNEMAARVADREASLRRSRDQLRALSRRLLAIQEEERVRIAREVHDELGQSLTAMKIELLQLGREHPAAEERLAEAGRSIDQTVEIVRRIAADLRPSILDDLGIAAALEQQLRRLREWGGLRTSLQAAQDQPLDMLTSVTLYRIAREALTNVVRHAHASRVDVSLEILDGNAVLKIRDDGEGIAPEKIEDPHSLGLVGMRERAELLGGQVVVERHPEQGTILIATLPMGT